MCGIVGYTGEKQAAPILLNSLCKLEYRGYDSAGICIQMNNTLQVEKSRGRIEILREQTENGGAVPGCTGIGHTRWATHGAPSDRNSHPHLSYSGKIAVVHNGIIENEATLREQLVKNGVSFCSETDSEVVANLIGFYYERRGDFIGSVRQAVARIRGSYALGILCADTPGRVVAVKKDSPLVVGFGHGESFIASDVTAILAHTRDVSYLDDGEMAVLDCTGVQFFDATGDLIEKKKETINWEITAAERGGYAHFMLKEIFEQPKAVRDTISGRIRNGRVVLDGIDLDAEYLKSLRKIYLVACGSAYYVSVLAKYIIEKTCRIPAEAVMASEFRYSEGVLDERNLVIVISQSGETADSLAALREAKRRRAGTLGIVNVVGSAIAKEADRTVYTCAGPEIAVATTKAFSTQLAVIYLLALYMAGEMKTVTDAEYNALIKALQHLPEDIEKTLSPHNLEQMQYYSSRFYGHHDAFYIGRNLDCAVCLEGSLKLKEIAYLHSEAYPAGELKHGPIALIEEGTLVVALATVAPLFEKTMSNIREVRARGADVLCITLESLAEEAAKQVQGVIPIPAVVPMLQPSLSLIPLQLLAYYIAVNRGCDVDKPKNLAKSVTVE
ncbi:MAG: glutamine--fructose-6-phosphate transaminase (isomerizing) [Oscillospiraceae bacterium]|nr:glutamine--fructose-6-phosphate transaminase (isomerizing) [Oscillospiraceae bacterium]